jgi:hypothetical protein
MHVGEFPLRPPAGLNDAELREWLAVVCELDRARLRLATRPSTLERISLSVLENVIPLAPHLPGKIGRWSRGILQGTNILRRVYDSMFNGVGHRE